MATLVQLINGKFVLSDAEEWRFECMARYVLAIPTPDARRAWLTDYERRRGAKETGRLKAQMTEERKVHK